LRADAGFQLCDCTHLLVLKWFDGDAERHYDERDGNRYRIHDGGYQ
jgi:hypothetical protein